MVLTGATAVALELARHTFPPDHVSLRGFGETAIQRGFWRYRALAGWFAHLLFVYPPALLLLRLRPRVIRFSAAMRQPGIVACLAMMATAVFEIVCYAMSAALFGTGLRINIQSSLNGIPVYDSFQFSFSSILLEASRLAPAMIAGSWLVLALSRRRRPAADWIDLAGRWLGAILLIQFLLDRIMDRI